MPIYEYQCNACHHSLEALQKISEAALTDCPSCNKPALQKLVSASSFQLKGTGWYATDFKTRPESKAAPKNETPSADTSPASGSTSPAAETKSAPTSTTTDKDGK